MPQFSANLGFLWTDRPLPAAIEAAAGAGFDAVECHWPYDVDAGEVRAALAATGLSMLGINTRRGDAAAGDNGLAALPGRDDEAWAAIAEAIGYAAAIGADSVHVMAGRAQGPLAHRTFVDNLAYAAQLAVPHGITILIEPLNRHDAPGYHLRTTDQARMVIQEVAAPNLKLMFDCYHVARTEGDVITRLGALLPVIGHIQFAGVPHRGAPDQGEIDYGAVFAAIDDLGWARPIGAEYRPDGDTNASLGWLDRYR
ncbi:MAG: TIM barrel protein [Actinomycetota bacterium]